jgi:hypothetical protein
MEPNVMIAALVSMLFATAACLALGAIAATWRQFGAAALSLREELANCVSTREMRFTVITTHVHRQGADTWRPGFRPLASLTLRQPRRREIRQPGLRAAA